MSDGDFDAAISAYRQALQQFVKGDPAPVLSLFSRADDVTLANPLGPPRRGPAAVAEVATEAAAHFVDGHNEFEEVSRYVAGDLGYVVQLEHATARLVGADADALISLRVTMIFRREGDAWLVAHRHADPITTARPITSTIAT